MSDPSSYLLERAWVDGVVHDDVLEKHWEQERAAITMVEPSIGGS